MFIDHIFIFTSDTGKIADELLNFGFSEGSSRVHHGQGTVNRKFYFKNFFLEVLWVHNEGEIKKPVIQQTGLTQRAYFKETDASPFGLCLVNDQNTDLLFQNAYAYQPEYFPEGVSIQILKNEENPSLPWTFRLPFKGIKKNPEEPMDHINGLQKLHSAEFEYKGHPNYKFLDCFNPKTNIHFKPSSRAWLNLSFNESPTQQMDFSKLKLSILY